MCGWSQLHDTNGFDSEAGKGSTFYITPSAIGWCVRGGLCLGIAAMSEGGKANIGTTEFARSRLPRSLLIAHSAAADAGFGYISFERIAVVQRIGWSENESLLCLICRHPFFEKARTS